MRRSIARSVLTLLGAGLTGAASGEAVAHAASRLDGRMQVVASRASQRRALRSTGLSEPTVRCFVRALDASAVAARVVQLGGQVGAFAGDVLTITLPVSAVQSLANDPQVMRLEAGTPVRAKLDRVAEAVRLQPVHAGQAPFATGYRGTGVVVGVIDLSLDLAHPAFRSEGHSRVVALWDQTGRQAPPEGFDYGRYCDRMVIDEGACPFPVESEHGSHVTGIAAGSQVSGSPYVGMAPAADIVFVHLADPVDESVTFDEWLSASVCDGVAFVFQVAAQLGQPAVVNLSLGTHTGPHDGTSLASACLDNLSGPGRIIVAAAGNEGEPWIHPWLDDLVYVHATGVADVAGQRVDFVPGDYVAEGEIVDIWFDAGGAATLRVGVESSAVAVATEPVPVGEGPVEALLATPRGDLGPVLITSDRTPSGATNYQVTVRDEDADLAETEYLWFFELTDAGRYDAFLDVNGGGGFVESDTGAGVDARMSIGFPAVARNVIAVGSSVSRTQWDNINGETYETYDYLTGEPLTLGQLSTFSSRGPTRNPTLTGMKPDLIAPGEMVASAMANGLGLDIIESTVVSPAPSGYFVGGGTSQSAPVVTGIVALMLERDPTLDPERVRDLLRATATAPANVDIPSDDWGYGSVVAALAVAATPDTDPAEPPPERVADGGCGCHVPSAEGAPATGLCTLLLGLGLATFRRRRRF